MFRTLLSGVAVLGLLLVMVAVHADVIGFDSTVIGSTNTDWGPTNLVVSKFDPNLGSLVKVTITLYADVDGTIKYENTGAEPRTVTGTLKADVSLYDSLANLLVTSNPSGVRSDDLPTYDGTTDYGGTSGKTYDGVTGSDNDSWSSTTWAEISQFVGPGGSPGNINLPTYAYGTSFASGGGNVSSQFITNAGAHAHVDYEYSTDIIPEPGTMALLGLGLAGLGGLRRRKKS